MYEGEARVDYLLVDKQAVTSSELFYVNVTFQHVMRRKP